METPQFPKRDPADPEFWDLRYDARFAPWDAGRVPAQLRAFVEQAGAPRRVLVPGCGSAWEVGFFARAGWDALGIDFSEAAVRAAAALLGPEAARVRQADFFAPIAGEPFEVVYERAFLCALPRRLWREWGSRVAGLTAAQLASRGIATLREVLEALGPAFFVDVELKEAAAVEAAIEAIEAVRGPTASRVVVSSFSRIALERLADRRPAWPRWLISRSPDAVPEAAELGCAAVALHLDALDVSLVADAHRRELQVMAWTIRDRATRDRVAAMGVDWLCVEGPAIGP